MVGFSRFASPRMMSLQQPGLNCLVSLLLNRIKTELNLKLHQLRLLSLSVVQRSSLGDRRLLRSALSKREEVAIICDYNPDKIIA